METIIESTTKIILLENEISNERTRLSSDRIDISFGELINLYRNKELIIRPDYQRLYRWNNNQKTAFIESLLLGIPVPPIFVAEDENGIWELVDGLQRISTFISFFGELNTQVSEINTIDDGLEDEEQNINLNNNWVLEAGSLIKNLEGFTIDTLPKKYNINLKRAVCRVEILRGENNVMMKYELFKRLNSSNSKLTPQEIRNAIYRSINPKLNDLITALSQEKLFKKLVQLTKQKRQELYDQELVLKFIAFLNNIENINDNTENFLNNFMEKSVIDGNFQYDHYKEIFVEVLTLIDFIEDDKIFRNTQNLFVPSIFEGVMIGVAQNIELYKNNPILLSQKINELKEDKEFKILSGITSSSKNRIKNKLTRANQIFNNSQIL